VRDREKGETTRFVSFFKEPGPAWAGVGSFAGKLTETGQLLKVKIHELEELKRTGAIRILTPEDVKTQMEAHEKKKIRRTAFEVRQMMERNDEVLIEGQIPAEILEHFRKRHG
jgi:hypothetical protein